MTLIQDLMAAGFAEIDAMTDEAWYASLTADMQTELVDIAAKMVTFNIVNPERSLEAAIVLIRTLAKEMR